MKDTETKILKQIRDARLKMTDKNLHIEKCIFMYKSTKNFSEKNSPIIPQNLSYDNHIIGFGYQPDTYVLGDYQPNAGVIFTIIMSSGEQLKVNKCANP